MIIFIVNIPPTFLAFPVYIYIYIYIKRERERERERGEGGERILKAS